MPPRVRQLSMELKEIVSELEGLFWEYVSINQLLQQTHGYKITDVRISFYKLSYHAIDATLHLIMFMTQGLKDVLTLNKYYQAFKLFNVRNRLSRYPNPEKFVIEEHDNVNQYLATGYFISIFSIFEHSFRILAKLYDHNQYKIDEGSINHLYNHFIPQYKKDSPSLDKQYTDFFDYLTTIRNSIHNNGRYISRGIHQLPKQVKDFDGIVYTFHHDTIISVNDVWNNNIRMTKAFSSIYNDIVLLPRFMKEPLIEDKSV